MRFSLDESCVLSRLTSVSSTFVLWLAPADRLACATTRFASPTRRSAASCSRASALSWRARCCSYFIVSASTATSFSSIIAIKSSRDASANRPPPRVFERAAADDSALFEPLGAPPDTAEDSTPNVTASRMFAISRWFCLNSSSLSSSIVARSSACFSTASARRSVIACCARVSARFLSATRSCSRAIVLCATAVTCATADSSPAVCTPPPRAEVDATCFSRRAISASRSSSAWRHVAAGLVYTSDTADENVLL